MEDIVEDQLSLASIHYLRSHYQEAIDIYKRILLDNREYLALNVYVALCYYKLDYYDVSQEVQSVQLARGQYNFVKWQWLSFSEALPTGPNVISNI